MRSWALAGALLALGCGAGEGDAESSNQLAPGTIVDTFCEAPQDGRVLQGRISFAVPDLASYPTINAIDGLTARACDSVECTSAPAGVTIAQFDDTPYAYDVEFDGAPQAYDAPGVHIRLDAPGYVSLDYYIDWPLSGTFFAPMLLESERDTLLAEIAATQDPGTGIVLTRAVACSGRSPIPDATLTSDEGQPTFTLSEPTTSEPEWSALGIANAPSGPHEVAFRRGMPEAATATGISTVVVRPGAIAFSEVVLWPN